MVHWDFELEDLAKVRFAISPMWETAAAINALRNPSLVATHLPWVKQIRPLIRHMDLTPALALLPSQGYIADFLTPPPSTPLASFADELEIVRATPTDQVLHDIQMLSKTPTTRRRWSPSSPIRAARSSGSPTCCRSSGSGRSSRTGLACARCSRRI